MTVHSIRFIKVKSSRSRIYRICDVQQACEGYYLLYLQQEMVLFSTNHVHIRDRYGEKLWRINGISIAIFPLTE